MDARIFERKNPWMDYCEKLDSCAPSEMLLKLFYPKNLNDIKKGTATVNQSFKAQGLFQLIDTEKFNALCEAWEIDKGIRKLTTWEHVTSHIVSFLLGLESLREVEQVLNIPRSTFSDANRNRCSGFYQALCEMVLQSFRPQIEDRRVRRAIKEVLAIDASVCNVHGSLASSNLWKSKSSKSNKASLHFHAVLSVENEMLEDFRVTPLKTMETTAARQFELKPNKIYVFDRAYRQVSFWNKIKKSGSDFVSRLVDSSPKRREQKHKLLRRCGSKIGVLHDSFYTPGNTVFHDSPEISKKTQYRYILYRDPETGKVFEFVTSNRKLSAQKIADIYRKRWAVELLFRWMKGHLKIRYIPCRDKNSVMIQMAMAALVQILVRIQILLHNLKTSSWELLRETRTQLLTSAANTALQEARTLKPSCYAHPGRCP